MDHCHITEKYTGSAHRDCNNDIKSNHKIPFAFYNLKISDFHLVMQKLLKFNLEKNVIPSRLKTYMSFSLNNKLSFIDCFQFLMSSLGSLVKNLDKNDFRYLNQEIENHVLDLVRQEGFYPYEHIRNYEKFKEQLPNREKLCSFLTCKKIAIKIINMFLKVGMKLKWKQWKISRLRLKMWCSSFKGCCRKT